MSNITRNLLITAGATLAIVLMFITAHSDGGLKRCSVHSSRIGEDIDSRRFAPNTQDHFFYIHHLRFIQEMENDSIAFYKLNHQQ